MSLPFGFTAPQLLLLLVPAVGADARCSAAPRATTWASAGGASRSVIRVVLLRLIVLALAGLQWVWPVDRLTTVFVVDLSDSRRHGRARSGRRRSCARRIEAATGRRPGRHRRLRRRRARRAAARRARRRWTASRRCPSRARPTSAARCGWRPRCSRTRRRSASCSSATATTRPAAASPRRRWRPRAACRSRPTPSASWRADEVIVQRLHTPVDGARRRGDRGRRSRSARPSPSRPPSGSSATARRSASQQVDLEAGTNTVVFTDARHGGRLPHLPGAGRGRPRHVRPERPRRLGHHRQGRPAHPGRGRRRGGRRGNLVTRPGARATRT